MSNPKYVKMVGTRAGYTAPFGVRWARGESHPVEKFTDEQLTYLEGVEDLEIVERVTDAPAPAEADKNKPKKLTIKKPQTGAEVSKHEWTVVDGVPQFPANGFDSKDKAEAFAKTFLDLDVDKRKGLKQLSEIVLAAYNAKFVVPVVEAEEAARSDGLTTVVSNDGLEEV